MLLDVKINLDQNGKTSPKLIVAFIILFSSVTSVLAFGSSSTSYKLEGEFGIFDGAKSSASYKLTDTSGGFAIGFGSSKNYGSGSVFQYVLAEIREIVFTIPSNSVDLASLSTSPKGVSKVLKYYVSIKSST